VETQACQREKRLALPRVPRIVPPGRCLNRGPGKPVDVTTAEDPTTAATRAFIYCVRTGTQPISDVHVGFGSDSLPLVQADQSRILKREVEVPSCRLQSHEHQQKITPAF